MVKGKRARPRMHRLDLSTDTDRQLEQTVRSRREKSTNPENGPSSLNQAKSEPIEMRVTERKLLYADWFKQEQKVVGKPPKPTKAKKPLFTTLPPPTELQTNQAQPLTYSKTLIQSRQTEPGVQSSKNAEPELSTNLPQVIENQTVSENISDNTNKQADEEVPSVRISDCEECSSSEDEAINQSCDDVHTEKSCKNSSDNEYSIFEDEDKEDNLRTVQFTYEDSAVDEECRTPELESQAPKHKQPKEKIMYDDWNNDWLAAGQNPNDDEWYFNWKREQELKAQQTAEEVAERTRLQQVLGISNEQLNDWYENWKLTNRTKEVQAHGDGPNSTWEWHNDEPISSKVSASTTNYYEDYSEPDDYDLGDGDPDPNISPDSSTTIQDSESVQTLECACLKRDQSTQWEENPSEEERAAAVEDLKVNFENYWNQQAGKSEWQGQPEIESPATFHQTDKTCSVNGDREDISWVHEQAAALEATGVPPQSIQPEQQSQVEFQCQADFQCQPEYPCQRELQFQPQMQFQCQAGFQCQPGFQFQPKYQYQPELQFQPAAMQYDPKFHSQSEFQYQQEYQMQPEYQTPPPFQSPHEFHSPSKYQSPSSFHSTPPFQSPPPFQPPTDFQPPAEYQSPIEFESPIKYQSSLEYHSPHEFHSPIEYESPPPYQMQRNFQSPTEYQHQPVHQQQSQPQLQYQPQQQQMVSPEVVVDASKGDEHNRNADVSVEVTRNQASKRYAALKIAQRIRRQELAAKKRRAIQQLYRSKIARPYYIFHQPPEIEVRKLNGRLNQADNYNEDNAARGLDKPTQKEYHDKQTETHEQYNENNINSEAKQIMLTSQAFSKKIGTPSWGEQMGNCDEIKCNQDIGRMPTVPTVQAKLCETSSKAQQTENWASENDIATTHSRLSERYKHSDRFPENKANTLCRVHENKATSYSRPPQDRPKTYSQKPENTKPFLRVLENQAKPYSQVPHDKAKSLPRAKADKAVTCSRVHEDKATSYSRVPDNETRPYSQVPHDKAKSLPRAKADKAISCSRVHENKPISCSRLPENQARPYSQVPQNKAKSLPRAKVDKAVTYSRVHEDKATSYSRVPDNETRPYSQVPQDKARYFSRTATDKTVTGSRVPEDKPMTYARITEKKANTHSRLPECQTKSFSRIPQNKVCTRIPMDKGTHYLRPVEAKPYTQVSEPDGKAKTHAGGPDFKEKTYSRALQGKDKPYSRITEGNAKPHAHLQVSELSEKAKPHAKGSECAEDQWNQRSQTSLKKFSANPNLKLAPRTQERPEDICITLELGRNSTNQKPNKKNCTGNQKPMMQANSNTKPAGNTKMTETNVTKEITNVLTEKSQLKEKSTKPATDNQFYSYNQPKILTGEKVKEKMASMLQREKEIKQKIPIENEPQATSVNVSPISEVTMPMLEISIAGSERKGINDSVKQPAALTSKQKKALKAQEYARRSLEKTTHKVDITNIQKNESENNQSTTKIENKNQLLNNCVPRETEKFVKRPVENTMEKSVEKSVQRPLSKPVQKLGKKTVELPVDKLGEKPVEKVLDNTIQKKKSAEKLGEMPVENLVEKAGKKLGEKPAVKKAVEKPIEKTKNKPIGKNKSVEKIVENPIEKPTEKPVVKPAKKPTKKTVEQTVGTGVKKLVEKPIEMIIENSIGKQKSIEQLVEKPVEKPKEKLIKKFIEITVDKPIEKPFAKPEKKTVEETVDKPIENVLEKPIEKATEKPIQMLSEKVAEKTCEKPIGKSDEKLIDNPSEEPAEKRAKKTVKASRKSVKKPVKKSVEKPVERSSSIEKTPTKPVEKYIEKAADKPTEKIAKKAIEELVEKPVAKSIEKSGKSIEKSCEMPLEKSFEELTEMVIENDVDKSTDNPVEISVDEPMERIIEEPSQKGKNDIEEIRSKCALSDEEILSAIFKRPTCNLKTMPVIGCDAHKMTPFDQLLYGTDSVPSYNYLARGQDKELCESMAKLRTLMNRSWQILMAPHELTLVVRVVPDSQAKPMIDLSGYNFLRPPRMLEIESQNIFEKQKLMTSVNLSVDPNPEVVVNHESTEEVLPVDETQIIENDNNIEETYDSNYVVGDENDLSAAEAFNNHLELEFRDLLKEYPPIQAIRMLLAKYDDSDRNFDMGSKEYIQNYDIADEAPNDDLALVATQFEEIEQENELAMDLLEIEGTLPLKPIESFMGYENQRVSTELSRRELQIRSFIREYKHPVIAVRELLEKLDENEMLKARSQPMQITELPKIKFVGEPIKSTEKASRKINAKNNKKQTKSHETEPAADCRDKKGKKKSTAKKLKC